MHRIATCAALSFTTLTTLLATGCGAAKAPDVAMQELVTDTTRGELGAVWRALPASYQADVQDLLACLAAKLDPQIYDAGFALLRQGLAAVRAKPDLQAFTPPEMIPAALGQSSRELLDICDALVAGPIRTVEGVRTLDVGRFLDRAGRAVVTAVRDIAAAQGADLDAVCDGLRVTVQEISGSTCTLVFASGVSPFALPVPFRLVEGKWIPVALAAGWQDTVRKARAAIETMPSMREPATRKRMQAELARARKQLEMFEKATSGEELSRMLNPRPGK